MTDRVRELGRAFLANRRPATCPQDADARRMNMELDAIRARFPDHA